MMAAQKVDIAGTSVISAQKDLTSSNAEFFQTRPGLRVSSDLQRYIDFSQSSTGQLQLGILLHSDRKKNQSEAAIFGLPGTPEREETLRTAVTLTQIEKKISAQCGGAKGELLNNGRANLFAIIGKSGELYVAYVYWRDSCREWYVDCDPWCQHHVWSRDIRVFHNS